MLPSTNISPDNQVVFEHAFVAYEVYLLAVPGYIHPTSLQQVLHALHHMLHYVSTCVKCDRYQR